VDARPSMARIIGVTAVAAALGLAVGLVGTGALIVLRGEGAAEEKGETLSPEKVAVARERLEYARRELAPRVLAHAAKVASFGSRTTGSAGCRKSYEYLAGELRAVGLARVKEYEFDVTVPVETEAWVEIGGVRLKAHALRPNCVHPCNTPREGLTGPLVYVGKGSLAELSARPLEGAIALMEFNSGDAWQRAADFGAKAVVFIEPDFVTTKQADQKYLETVPLGFTRLWVGRAAGAILRRRAAATEPVDVTVGSRVKWEVAGAPCIEGTVPGRRPETVVVCAQFDSQSIVPAAAPGGDTVWGPAALVEMARYFRKYPPGMTLRFLLFSGSQQDLAGPRQYLGIDEHREEIGRVVRAAFSLDLSSESKGVAVTHEGYHGQPSWFYTAKNTWLKSRIFPPRGVWYELLETAGGEGRHPLYGNSRPMHYNGETSVAPRKHYTPLTFSPKNYTASEPWGQLEAPSYCLTTEPKRRFSRRSPLDTFGAAARKQENIAPQVETISFFLDRVASLDPGEFLYKGREWKARDSRGAGGYVELTGRLAEYRTEKVWYRQGIPEDADGEPVGDGFVYVYPTYRRSEYPYFLHLPMAPWKQCHQNLQSHMVKYLVKLGPDGAFSIPCVYLKDGDTRYNVLGYVLDREGNVAYAPDLGLQGDVSFRQANVPVSTARPFFQATVFPCGSLAVFDLVDPARYAFNKRVFNEGYIQWGWPGQARLMQDFGEHGFLPMNEVKEAKTQTDAQRYGHVQYQSTGIFFLPEGTPCIGLLGHERKKFLVLGNFKAGQTRPGGYALERGEQKILRPGVLRCLKELWHLDTARLKKFGDLGVKSRLAEEHHQRAAELAAEVSEDLLPAELTREAEKVAEVSARPEDWPTLMRAWDSESAAYRATQSLKYDVVKTTVFYFILLIPFAFLIERLMSPQVTFLKTIAVSAGVFIVFAITLYWFHPGFKLAENIFVTIISFIIVFLTIPALLMLITRGVLMLKDLAGKYAEAHYAQTEKTGMLLSALSLSVSNMRRRKLRTTLTLGTITFLVMSLVLFTSATSFQKDFERPGRDENPPYEGIQIFNTYHHVHALLPETVRMVEEAMEAEGTVVRREYLNYGMKLVDPTKQYLYQTEGPLAPPEALVDAARQAEQERASAGKGTTKVQVQVTDRGMLVPSVQFVEPDEVNVTAPHEKALVGGRWFTDDDLFSCIISKTASETLRLGVGDTAGFEGFELKIVGVFDSVRMDKVLDLNAEPWTPILFSASHDEVDRPQHEPSAPVLFVPKRLADETSWFQTAVWSLVVVPDDRAKIPELARQLTREVKNVDVYESHGGNVTLHSAHATVSVSGAAFLLGPLLITFFMILNIMLGTVYERTREINIFSSVGLSPRHVALMFLTESVVYAAVASVLGYFMGVVLLTVFMRMELLPATFYPNYLGVVVIYATGLAAAATVTSSIYPMIIASRIVNPSLARTWRIDTEPAGGVWRIHFPFISHSTDETVGIFAFLGEFIEHNTGEPKGVFTAEPGIEFRPPAPSGDGAERAELIFTAWLAPFERNVTQRAAFAAELDPEKQRWYFSFELRHVSGPEYLWKKSNRYFLDQFRKQMLLWRAFPDELVAEYAARGRKLAESPVGAEKQSPERG